MKPIIFIATFSYALGFSLNAAVLDFKLDMDGAQAGTASLGTGGDLHQNFPAQYVGISYDTTQHQLRIPIGWGSANNFVDLEGTVDQNQLPLIRFGSYNWYSLSPIDVQSTSSGRLDITLSLINDPRGAGQPYSIADQEADLSQGLWYVSIPTVQAGNGEIRGPLAPVPEPQEYAMAAGLALLGFAAFRRYKKAVCK